MTTCLSIYQDDAMSVSEAVPTTRPNRQMDAVCLVGLHCYVSSVSNMSALSKMTAS